MRHGRVSLSMFFALTIGAIVLVAVALATGLGLLTARRLTNDLLTEKAVQSMATLERGLELHLRPVRNQVTAVAAMISDGSLDPGDRATTGKVLLSALTALPELTFLGIIDADFSRFSVLRQLDGNLVQSQGSVRDDAEVVARLNALQPGEAPQWSDALYIESLQDAVVNISMVVSRNGVTLGYVVAGLTTKRLTALVDTLGQQFGVTVFVLYGPDRVLAHPGLLATAEHGSRLRPLVGIDQVGDPVLAGMWSGTPLDHRKRWNAMGVAVTQVTMPDDEDYMIMHRTLSGYGGTPWILGVELSERFLDETMADLRRMAMAGAGILIMGLLAALLIAKLLARPIQRLTDGAREVATLEIGKVQPLPASRVRELDQQATAFNAMLSTLRAFEAYVPKSLVRRLIDSAGENGDGGWRANGGVTSRERDLTVMFTDIVGFTSLAERLTPVEVAHLLNHHFDLLAGCVEAEGGTVDKYLGDGMMAFWGAPERSKGRAARACRAALAIRQAIARDNEQRRAAGLGPVHVRIGIHRGPLLVGNIGAPSRVNYTVVGDAANVAQRLEELGRQWCEQEEVVILISDAVMQQAGHRFVIAPAGIVSVKGRSEPLSTWRLLGEADRLQTSPATPEQVTAK